MDQSVAWRLYANIYIGPPRWCGTLVALDRFHNLSYAIFVCSGYLVMRQLGQLEMRQSRLLMRWSMPTSGARMTTSSLVETMSGRSRHVLFDHHVAERIASPRSRSKDP
ncbi:hypothetical protein ELI41_09790 [Rhizobium leguminosarum]|nr:hypothetical protein ELI41_09790 [Rhizobium leguminosarum]TAV53479.1 hypothetical protein ELI29_10480 [Rhizobium leguminosarum]